MKIRIFFNLIKISLAKKNFCSKMQTTINIEKNYPRVSFIQRPGDSYIRNITLIPGEGIGRELVKSLIKVNEIIKPPIIWDLIDDFNFSNKGCIEILHKNMCILKGPVVSRHETRIEENITIAKSLDLFANVVHAFTIPGIKTRHKNIDIVVIRENTEGEYSGLEHEVYPGVIESIKVITKRASLRLAEYAFEYAYLTQRKKVTAVHKANIMKLCDGQFLEATRSVSTKYPDIKYEEIIIDNCCMQLILKPQQFDVMVMPNLYGAIVSNIALGITGGPGITPGAMIGTKYSIFETGGRHAAKDIAGKNMANPTSFLLSYVMMLKHIGLTFFAQKVENAIYKTLLEGNVKTFDIDGKNSTMEFTEEMNTSEPSESNYKTATDILFFYINHSNLESAYALLKEGEINLEIKNDLGITPLFQATQLSNLNLVNLLLDFGANPNCRTEQNLGHESPLIIASANNFFDVANLLLDFGADPTAKDGYGLTCLHHSAKNGHIEMSLLLISRGCDANIRDDYGNNSSYWAKKNNHLELLKFLPLSTTVTPLENKNFRDIVENFRTADKKKIKKK